MAWDQLPPALGLHLGPAFAVPKARPHPDSPKQGHCMHLPAAAASP